MVCFNRWFPFNSWDERNNGRTLIFCFHHAGGMAMAYKKWIEYNDVNWEFVPVELPGRGCRAAEPSMCNINEIAYGAAKAISEFSMGRKVIIYGHSMGARIAFQVAYELENSFGLFPLALFVSVMNAPGAYYNERYNTEMNDDYLIKELRYIGAIPEEILNDQKYMEYFLPIIKKDYMLHELFSGVGEKLNASIYVYNGKDDALVNHKVINRWSEHTLANTVIRYFEGKHFFLFDLGREYVSYLKNEMFMLRGINTDVK